MSVAPVVAPLPVVAKAAPPVVEPEASSWLPSLPSNPFASSGKGETDKDSVPTDPNEKKPWYSGYLGGKRRRKSNRKAMKGGSFSPYTAHSSASSASQCGGRRTRRHRTRRHKARKARKVRKSRKHRR